MGKEPQNLSDYIDSADIDWEELLEQLTFDTRDVATAAQEQPKYYMDQVTLHVQKTRAVNQSKAKLLAAKAESGAAAREALGKDGTRVTEGAVTEYVNADESVIKATARLARAEELELWTKLFAEAGKMRRDGIAHHVQLFLAEGRHQSSLEGSELEKTKEKLRKKYPGGKK